MEWRIAQQAADWSRSVAFWMRIRTLAAGQQGQWIHAKATAELVHISLKTADFYAGYKSV